MPAPSVFFSDSETRKVLAIDGGGMRGALAVGIIAQLEQTLRDKFGDPNLVLADYFDLIGGTSTGAIIAAGLALGQDAAYLRALYHQLGPIVFAPPPIPRIPIFQSKFDPKLLGQVIVDELHHVDPGDRRLAHGLCRRGQARRHRLGVDPDQLPALEVLEWSPRRPRRGPQ